MLMLWSVPRSRSTAFYRMMIERGDFTGAHEPFSHASVFGNAGIGGGPLATVPEVLAGLRSLATTRQVFIKETTDRRHSEALADQRFLAEDAQHTFLIRHPRETIRSYLAVRRNPRIHEIGFESQYEVYTKVSSLTGRDPLVVDAGDLMRRPADTRSGRTARTSVSISGHMPSAGSRLTGPNGRAASATGSPGWRPAQDWRRCPAAAVWTLTSTRCWAPTLLIICPLPAALSAPAGGLRLVNKC